jgi:hypothetical protein
MFDVIVEIIKILLRLVFEILFAWTGEIVLYIITFGRHNPRWDLYAKQSPARFVIFSEISLWIGMAFWIAVIALLYKLLAKG